MKWDKLHTITAAAVAVSIISVGTTAYVFTHPAIPSFSSMTVSPRSLQETVSLTGPVVSAKNVDLSFDRSGRVARTYVSVGQTVKAGQSLVELENTMEAGQLAQAQAALNARMAGPSAADLSVSQAAVAAALADLNKAKADTNTSNTYAYQNAETVLRLVSVKLDDALTAADNILGINNTLANDDIEKYLAISNSARLAPAQDAFQKAIASREKANIALRALNGSADHAAIEAAFKPSADALLDASTMLDRVSDVLSATPAVGTLTQSGLDAKKLTISNIRTSVGAQTTALVSAQQAVTNAKNAQSDTTGADQGLIAIKQAVYDQAVAALEAKKAAPRDVDLAPFRAAVEIASGSYQKTVLRAPSDGVVARMDAKAGAIVSPGLSLVSVVNPSALQVEGLLSEKDVVKVHVGDSVFATTDAYGTGVTFPATVVSVDQSVTTTPAGSGYKVAVQFTGTDERLKTGMQASVTIHTQSKENVLAVPARSITQKNASSFVQVVETNGKTKEVSVQTGMTSNDGYVEIVSGLHAQDRVVTFGNN